MARTVRDSNLETRTARSRLKARGKPYYRTIEPGLHLGYRKPLSGAGKWAVRRYIGKEAYAVETLATADDFSDADGVAILSFKQAQHKARDRMVKQAHTAEGITGPYTVADAMDAYLDFLKADGRSKAAIKDAEYRDRAFVRPKLGVLEIASLAADRLRRWRNDLAKAPPRLRTKSGKPQRHRKESDDDDAQRARRASANRTWTTLRAALNHAFANDKVDSDKAWRKVKPFKNVDKARVRYLTVAEAKRLINGSDPEFRSLVHAALLTGARYGQLAQLTVADFNPDVGTVRLRTRKGDGTAKVYHAHLTDEGIQFFKSTCAGRGGADLIFTKGDGSPWRIRRDRLRKHRCGLRSARQQTFM
jgi:integrase